MSLIRIRLAVAASAAGFLLSAAVLVTTAAPISAQTFIVDAANGPGTNFTDLPLAVATVPDGAVLLVRPGSYGAVDLDGKGMSILATAPGVRIEGPFTMAVRVVNLGVGQAFTLRGVALDLSGAFWQARKTGVHLQACAGPVLLQGLPHLPILQSPVEAAVFADACAAVTLRECYLPGSLHARNAQVVVEHSSLRGIDAFDPQCWFCIGWAASPGVWVEGGTVTMARCQVRGGNDYAFGDPPPPAVMLDGGELRLCEDPSAVYAAGRGVPWSPPTPAIGGTAGTVVRAPGAVLSGSHGGPAVAAALTDVVRPLPSLRTTPAGPGGTVIVDVTTPLGEVVLLFAALPGPVTAVPGVDGFLWLDTATAVLVAVGVPQSGAPVRRAIGIPNTPALVAARFCLQAVAWNATDALRASNPSTFAL